MEVILLESVPKLGQRGATVKVKPGFARNFLFPQRLALPASDGNRKVFQQREVVVEKKDRIAMEAAQKRAAGMSELSVTIPVQVGEEDKLYGSVTTQDIGKALAAAGHEIERKQILLDDVIRQLGVYTVDIRLHREVKVPLKVWVVKE